MDKTPLQKLQDDAAHQLLPRPCPKHLREALDAFLVRAYDMGAQAHRELMEAVVRTEEHIRVQQCTCRARDAGYAHTAGLHTGSCQVNG